MWKKLMTKECGKKGLLALLKVLFGHSFGQIEERQQNLQVGYWTDIQTS
jgi:hypothetical protein